MERRAHHRTRSRQWQTKSPFVFACHYHVIGLEHKRLERDALDRFSVANRQTLNKKLEKSNSHNERYSVRLIQVGPPLPRCPVHLIMQISPGQMFPLASPPPSVRPSVSLKNVHLDVECANMSVLYFFFASKTPQLTFPVFTAIPDS